MDLTTVPMQFSRWMHADAPCSGACHGACSWRSIAGASPEHAPRQAPLNRPALLRLLPMSSDHS